MEHDLTRFLRVGKNEILLLAYDPLVPIGSRDLIEPWWMGEVLGVKQGKELSLVTSNTSRWECQEGTSWESDVLLSGCLRDYSEVYRAKAPGAHPRPDYDRTWKKCAAYPEELLALVRFERTRGTPPVGEPIRPKRFRCTFIKEPPFRSRKICEDCAEWAERRLRSVQGDWLAYMRSKEDLFAYVRRGALSIVPVKYIPLDGNRACFPDSCRWQHYRGCIYFDSPRRRCSTVLLDFGSTESGLWQIEVESKKRLRIHIAYSEQLNPDGTLRHDTVDSDFMELPSGKSTWQAFQHRGARFVLLGLEGVSPGLKLDFAVVPTSLETAPRIHVMKDEFLKEAVVAAAETLRRSFSDAFFDGPWRERAQWLGDSLMMAEVMADLFDSPEPWRRLLLLVSELSNTDEFLRSVVPGEYIDRLPYFDLLAVVSALRFTSLYEKNVSRWLLRFVVERIRTFYRYTNPAGLLENLPERNFMDWTVEHPLPPVTSRMIEKWIRDRRMPSGATCYDFLSPRTRGINAAMNASWLEALEAAALMSKMANRRDLEGEFSSLRKRALKSYREFFWDDKEALVRDRVPEILGLCPWSEHAGCAALAAGLLTREEARRVIRNLWAPHRRMIRILSPYGARLMIRGLLRYDRPDLALSYLKRIYRPMLRRGQTLWEDFTGCNSRCHGWAAYPIWLYARKAKGLLPAILEKRKT